MKRSLRAAMLAAGVLLAVGCSSNGAGTGSAASTTAASSGSMTPDSMGSETMSSASERSGGPAGDGAAPVALDQQTVTWFTTLCQGLAPIGEVSFDMSGQDAAGRQETALLGVQQYEKAYSDTSAMLQATAPPTFEGGTDLADRVRSGLSESAPKLAAVARSVSAVNPNDKAAWQQAAKGLEAQVAAAVAPLQQFTQLPPGVVAAVMAIPACKGLGG